MIRLLCASGMGGRALLFSALIWAGGVSAEEPANDPLGQSHLGRSNYVEYIAGNLPIIFSAPHGGALTPDEIPDRICSDADDDFATVTDANTVELALAIREAFHDRFGRSPHFILCHLKRTKVDCNRDLESGAGTNRFARQAWFEFHRFIDAASNSVARQTGRGLYIDLHGQSHPLKRLELGYSLTGSQLTNTDAALDAGGFSARSSLAALAAGCATPFSQLLRGTNSLGGLLAARGYPAVPSPLMPSPGDGSNPTRYPGDRNPYFSGGFNLRAHTPRPGQGSLAGLQLEANLAGVRDTAAHRAAFARALAAVLETFFLEHYRLDLKAAPTGHKVPTQLGDAPAAASH